MAFSSSFVKTLCCLAYLHSLSQIHSSLMKRAPTRHRQRSHPLSHPLWSEPAAGKQTSVPPSSIRPFVPMPSSRAEARSPERPRRSPRCWARISFRWVTAPFLPALRLSVYPPPYPFYPHHHPWCQMSVPNLKKRKSPTFIPGFSPFPMGQG